MSWPTDRWPLAAEIQDQLTAIAGDSHYSTYCSVTESANATAELAIKPKWVRIGKLTGGASTRSRVLFVGGHHAREWAPPTLLTNFITLLLDAKNAGTPITIGSVTVGPADINNIIENVDLYILPLANPDGYNFSQLNDAALSPSDSRGWRKNRRPAPSPMPPGASCVPDSTNPADPAIGVDVNRNYDVLWNFDLFYVVTPGFPQNSKDPCQEIFIGSTAAFSEAESQNVKALMDLVDPQFYVDVHMSGRHVEHAWGTTAENSPVPDPTPVLNTGRVRNASFKEPIGTDFQTTIQATANHMADATGRATSTTPFNVGTGGSFAPISGASDDYATSRNLGTSKPLIQAFTVECGNDFLPLFATEFPDIQREVHAALLSLLRMAAGPLSTSGPQKCSRCHC